MSTGQPENSSSVIASSIQRGYDRWSSIYDAEANPLVALEEPNVRERVGNVAGLSVLDLGCGTGRHALWLAAAGARVTAIDFSEGMLDKARQKPGARQVQFLAHDLHQPLPFGNSAFEAVVSGLVLEHLQDLPGLFAETRRVLMPGGRAVFSTMHPAMFLRGTQARFTDPESGELVQPGSIAHSHSAIVMSALQAGLELKEVAEFTPDDAFAAAYPRAQKYIGWPMLLILSLTTPRVA